MLEIPLLVEAARKSAETIRVVSHPMLGEEVSPVPTREHSCSYYSFSDLEGTTSMSPEWVREGEGHKTGLEVLKGREDLSLCPQLLFEEVNHL